MSYHVSLVLLLCFSVLSFCCLVSSVLSPPAMLRSDALCLDITSLFGPQILPGPSMQRLLYCTSADHSPAGQSSAGDVATKGSLQCSWRLQGPGRRSLSLSLSPAAADEDFRSAGPNWAGTRSGSPASRSRLRGLSACH
jgi:hypothetical protein